MSLLDNIFVNLRVLSKIPEGGRISTTGTGQIKLEDTKSLGGWVATGRRKITGDSREETVKILMQLVNDVTLISDNIINSLALKSKETNDVNSIGIFNENAKKCYELNKLCTMLKDGKKGVVNLYKSTYSDDITIMAKLDEILDRMVQQHDRISQVLRYVNAAHSRDIETISKQHDVVVPPVPASPVNHRGRSVEESEEDLGEIF